MVARSVAADRGGAAHRCQADGKSGIEAAWFFIARTRILRSRAVNPLM
jgi:hypothetical protein